MEIDIMDIDIMREWAKKSPCKVIKFSASDGEKFSYNGEFYANCEGCKRKEIEQPYPDCKANHAEWGVLSKSSNNSDNNIKECNKEPKNLYIYCMTPDNKDYPFTRFWCQTCSILIPMFNFKNVYMWDGNIWIWHDPKNLIAEANAKALTESKDNVNIKIG